MNVKTVKENGGRMACIHSSGPVCINATMQSFLLIDHFNIVIFFSCLPTLCSKPENCEAQTNSWGGSLKHINMPSNLILELFSQFCISITCLTRSISLLSSLLHFGLVTSEGVCFPTKISHAFRFFQSTCSCHNTLS
jgi:hypothetical protein